MPWICKWSKKVCWICSLSTPKNFLSLIFSSFLHFEMRLPPHRGGFHDMMWLMKMETILFRPPLANFYMQCLCGVRGTHVCGVRGTRVCVRVSTNLESPPIMRNWGVIGHLCLIDFILLRYIKNGLEPEMGSGVRLCMEKVLDTLRHPLKAITSLLVFLYVCLA